MDQSWRHPRPNQGSICPTCSISHFPFCPPHPHPSRPNFEPNRGPINMGRPDFVNNQDPFRDPGYRNRNPNLPPQLGYNNVSDDRSSKRLRVDEGSVVNDYGGVNTGFGFDGGLRRYPHESLGFDRNVDSREVGGLRMGDKVGMGLGHGVHYPHESSGFDRNVDSLRMVNIGEMGVGHGVHYPHERSGFERNVDSLRVVNQGEMGVGHGVHYPHKRSGFDRNVDSSRVVNQGEMGNLVGVGHGVHYQKDDYGYRSGYDSGYNVDHGRLGNEYHGRNYELGVAHPPNHGSFSHGGFGVDNESQSFGYRPPNYGNNFEHVQSNGNAMHFDKRSNMAAPNEYPSTRPPFQPGQMGYGYHSPHHFGGVRQPVDPRPPPVEGYQSVVNQNVPTRPPFEPPHMSKPSEYGNSFPEYVSHMQPPQRYEFQPPLPSSPPPPLPKEPPIQWSAEHNHSSSPKKEFPPHMRSSAAVHYPHPPTADSHVRVNPALGNIKIDHASRGSFQGESQGITPTFGQYSRSSQALPSKNNLPDKPRALDAADIFKRPHRTSRPDHFVIILRGLPGSGKSYFAKMLRDLELEHGGSAPRVHSMDDYFMTEVEKTEENEGSKPLARGKKPVTKTVIEYCYEPEMEEAYRSSMLKAFKKTLEEGVYTFVIVDDRNLRVADFAQFWATAKRSGYEAYVLEAPYKDPAGCAARNVHGFTQNDVEKMAAQWEESPSLYLQLDVKSLFHGDDLKESSIKEVDMDMEDGDFDTSLSNWDEKQAEKTSLAENISLDVSPNDERNLDSEIGNQTEEVKDLGRSKWSNNLDDEGDERSELLKGRANVLSGLLGTYGKEGKSVHWGDQGGHSGFSIGKKAKMASLVIGPGAGYNLKSNPLAEEDTLSGKTEETKKHNVFKQRLQAERESFRAVFDGRRHRNGGVFAEEE